MPPRDARFRGREADRRCRVCDRARACMPTIDRPLNAVASNSSEDAADWRRETVTFDAAYGNERVIAYVYLPKTSAPPFQTMVYFPGGDAQLLRSSRELNLTNVDFVDSQRPRAGLSRLQRHLRARRDRVRPQRVSRPDDGACQGFRTGRGLHRHAPRPRCRPHRVLRRQHGRLSPASIINAPRAASEGDASSWAAVWPVASARRRSISLNFVPRMHAPTLMVNGD